MTYQVRNVIVGAAALYLGTSDSSQGGYSAPALPASPAAGTSFTTALDGSANFRHVGLTDGGLTVTYTPTYTDVTVDQLLDAAKIFKTALTVTVGTTLSEATLDNLLVAWGQQSTGLTSTTSDSTLGIASGALGDDPIERVLAAVGPAPRQPGTNSKRERVYYARRVLAVESNAHSLARAAATTFPVSFRLLPDTTQPVGQEYGIIRDRNI